MRFTRRGAVLRQIDHLFRVGTASGHSDAEFLRRFVEGRDEGAFAALVDRHGAMVLAVCQGVLRSRHDAEDASQATFLILARKARTLRVVDSLGGWLHRVAHRVAVQAAIEMSRRRAREQRSAVSEVREAEEPDGSWHERLGLLHEEIGRLPEKYRTPIVLCDLESMTREQAAGQLGWPPGTVAGRLARGRDLLKDRLTRRGLAPAGGIAGGLLAARQASAALPRSWVEATASAALRVAAARSLSAGMVPAAVLSLAQGAIHAMFRSRVRRALAALTIGIAFTGLVAAALAWAPQRDDAALAVTGTVIGPDGKPAAGVGVFGTQRPDEGGFGHVVAEGRTDGEGRFRLELPASAATRGWGLWAYRPGNLMAAREMGPGTTFPELPVRLVLGPAARTVFQVRAPDGKPVAKARIRPRVLNRGFLSVPDGLGERIEAEVVTGADGRAVMTALFTEDVRTVLVTASGYGTQQFGFGMRDDEVAARVIDLLPVGRVRGRIVGDPAEVGGRRLTVLTYRRSHPAPSPGLYDVTTDAEGRFEVPEVVEGNLSIIAREFDPRSRRYPKLAPGKTVAPGETTVVELTLANCVRVRGVVRARGTGAPIAGALVVVAYRGTPVLTDAEGRYEGFAPPGRINPYVISTTQGYTQLIYGGPEVNVPEGTAEQEMPPIELTRGGTVRGSVVDEQDRPVAGAQVDAAWVVNEGPRRNGQTERRLGTDARGEFRVESVPLDAAVTLKASHHGRQTAGSVSTRAGDEPVRLRLETDRAVALQGRLLDEEGKPIAGGTVHFRVQTRSPSGQPRGDDPVAFESTRVATTDADGRYTTPRELDRDEEYAAFVEADGFRTSRTSWVGGAAGRFPELVLRRVQAEAARAEWSARVADRQGVPVAGARVWLSSQRPGSARVSTDARGWFRLEGPAEGRALLFVEASGFRLHGQVVESAGGLDDVVLTRPGEAPLRRRSTLPPALPARENLALARRLLDPYVDRVLKEGNETDQYRTLMALAAIDPGRVLEVVATKQFATEGLADRLKSRAANALFRDSPDEALAVLESIDDASIRAYGLMPSRDVPAAADRTRTLRRLDRALLAARAITDPVYRVPILGQIAERWLDLGEEERGTKLLRELTPVARELPTQARGGYARGAFAEELAQVDPDAALALIEGIDAEGPVPDRHRLNIAQELAGRDPARAEQVVDRLRRPESLGPNLSRIVYAMAPVDPARARQLVGRVARLKDERDEFPFARPHALAMMALATADQPSAVPLIAEAFADLGRIAPEERRHFLGMQTAASVAASLLPVVERVDPTRVPESFWLAASLRVAPPAAAGLTPPDAVLALFLARYDREAARTLLEPILARGLAERSSDRDPILWAAAAVDPRRVVAMVEALPDDPDASLNLFKNRKNLARLALAGILSTPADGWWDAAVQKVLHLWTVGREDLF